jgi:UDP-N-acetylmuramoyl-tripeptide--D-alanyl-D-alanine ligase
MHHVANALAAATCALVLGLDLKLIGEGLAQVLPVAGRMEIRQHHCGACVIDDTYNANTASMKAAIDAAVCMQGKKIAVFGSMAELGDFSEALHREVGTYAKQQGMDSLFAVGEGASAYAKGFGSGAEVLADQEQLIQRCLDELSANVVYLVKGSRSAQMEKVVNALLRERSAC